MDRKAALFPLDNSCNWMVKSAIHAGACKVSEAVLCAGDRAGEVVSWAFENQDEIRTAAAKDGQAAQRMVTARFPALASCLGSAQVRARLNKSLRWAVRNRLAVLTPQLYVGGARLCDEDVDLGLDFALSRMIERQRQGTLKATPAPAAPAVAQPEPKEAAPRKPVKGPAAVARPVTPPPGAAPEEPAPRTGEALEPPKAPAEEPPPPPQEPPKPAAEEPPPTTEPPKAQEPTP
jgi:hypothetical protein